jgi:hypothetical protein
MTGRALDARRLAAALRGGAAAALAADPALNIEPGDRAEVAQTAVAWLAWYDGLTIEPESGTSDAWLPERMEYAVSIAARLSPRPEDEVTLSADEFDDGALDWVSFDVNAEVNMGTAADRTVVTITQTTIPAPLAFRGTPAPRFWELEDALIDYGLTSVGPTDLAHLMMIEYANSYGNDWFVVPLTLPIGSLTRIDSMVIADSFGARSRIGQCGRCPIGAGPVRSRSISRFPISSSCRPRPDSERRAARSRTFCSCATRWRTSRGRSSGSSRIRSSSRRRAWNRTWKPATRKPRTRPRPSKRRRAIGSRRASRDIGFRSCRCKPERPTAGSSRACVAERCCSPTDRRAYTEH